MRWYKFISIITLALPLPIYLFLSATLFNVDPTHKITGVKIEEISLHILEDEYFITTENKEAVMIGNVAYNSELESYGFYIDDKSILQLGYKYYGIQKNEDDNVSLIDIKAMEIKKQQEYKLPLSFMISLGAVLIVLLVVQGKMQWHKKYPRIATFIALLTGYIVLLVISTIVNDIKNVFLIATISWGMYCLEHMVYKGKMTSKESAKLQSDLLSELEGRLK